MVSAPATLGESSLKGVGYICILHKLHKPSVEDACEKFSKTASDGNRTVICRVTLGAFFVEGGNVGFLPGGRKEGGMVNMTEEVGEEWQA